ncbi:hypothetical protein PEX1_063500 [Penicillium expansum]|nr:hypothetical protein PEX1_063500 [Penicillium expansum]
MLRYGGLFSLVCNSPVQGQVVTRVSLFLHSTSGGPKSLSNMNNATKVSATRLQITSN